MASNQEKDYFIKGIRNGDDKIIRAFYQENFPKVAAFILNNKGVLADAKDVFQDAVMLIYQQHQRIHIETSLNQYFYGICRNIWYQRLRKQQKMTHQVTEKADDFELNDALEQRQKYKLFQQKFALLGEQCKRILQLFFAKKNMEDIAEIMGFSSAGYAKKKKYTCKKELTQLVKKDQTFKELYNR